MSRPSLLVAVLLCSTLVACDPYALQRRQALLATYVGQDETAVVRGFGIPTRAYDTGGHRFLEYIEQRTDIEAPFYPDRPWGLGWAYGGGFPAQAVEYVCDTTFELVAGRVVGATLRGNACG